MMHAGGSALVDRATDVLRQVFATAPGDFAFRLWDGTLVTFGSGPPAFTVSVPAADTFLRLMRDPTPLAFAEAYVEGALDIEGDLFATMQVANALEDVRLPLAHRLRLLVSMGSAALRPAARTANDS
ncbi:MAG: SCP2 sterol-binding domain-containing protein [Candidatus Rokubacteria bacterium]|nr:SCP2 sterol-binding domain-containing protein [Candidatus Rokubacteria bacterium]